MLYLVQGKDVGGVNDCILLDYLHHVTTQNPSSNVEQNGIE
jgi:hypothetical protein